MLHQGWLLQYNTHWVREYSSGVCQCDQVQPDRHRDFVIVLLGVQATWGGGDLISLFKKENTMQARATWFGAAATDIDPYSVRVGGAENSREIRYPVRGGMGGFG